MNDTVQNVGQHLSKLGNFMPFLFVFFLYLLVIRPQQKKEKKRREVIANLKKGDVVLTNSGIKGVVEKVSDNDIIIGIAKGVGVSFLKNTIACVVEQHKEENKESVTVAPRHSAAHYRKKKTSAQRKKKPSQPTKD
jgi:preprotein translocase subunit YajC